MKPDTYFFNPQEALRVAQEQNRSDDVNKAFLQLCYYNGEKIESDLINLIHLPVDNLIDDLAQGTLRIPTHIDFTDFDISLEVAKDIETNLLISLDQAKAFRAELNKIYLNRIKEAKLDFSEPLRFYLPAHSSTRVMQHVSKNIVNVLIENGHDVLFDLQMGIEDLNCRKKMFEYNPHVTININHFNNAYISSDAFNFVWFQDPMPVLTSNELVYTRNRDYVFSLLKSFDDMLQKKNVKYERQGFCFNKNMFKLKEPVKKEKKIVFIGSSYTTLLPDNIDLSEAIKELNDLFVNGISFDKEVINRISIKYSYSKEFVEMKLIPSIIRDFGVIGLCEIDTEYEIEIYGWGWDSYESLAPYYKGVLEYGDDIAKVYANATFAFAPHQLYTIQQRTLEATASGTIPIVYDCRDLSGESSYDDALCYFKTMEDLKEILQSEVPKKDFSRLLKDYSYDTFIEKILTIINEDLKDG